MIIENSAALIIGYKWHPMQGTENKMRIYVIEFQLHKTSE